MMKVIKKFTLTKATIVFALIVSGGFFYHHIATNVYAECSSERNICTPKPSHDSNETSDGWCGSTIDMNHYEIEQCIVNNQKALSDAGQAISSEDYKTAINSCVESNDQPAGYCANAYVSCVLNSIQSSNCKNSEYVSAIAQDVSCNNGRLTGDKYRVSACTPIKNDNIQVVKAVGDKYYDDIIAQCETPDDKKACGAAAKKAQEECNSSVSNATIGEKINLADYEECIRKSVISQAKDNQNLCNAAGGIYINKDTKDPNGPNALSKGCYNQASDLTNPEACSLAGKGYVWKRTGGGTRQDDYGCVDPNAVCKDHGGGQAKADGTCPDGTKVQDDNFADGVHGSIIGPSSNCGAAKTNLIACKGQGEQALGDVLKIIISVLTVIIGIAATGGLAWAAILYAKAEDNASNVSEAKTLIRNIVIGILLYGFMIAIVNWLVPGGVIG